MIESYKPLFEALIHAGIHTNSQINTIYIGSEDIEKQGIDILANMDAILVPGGFIKRVVESKIMTINFARMDCIPYLDTFVGMCSLAIVKYARDETSMKDAHTYSIEFNLNTRLPGHQVDH